MDGQTAALAVGIQTAKGSTAAYTERFPLSGGGLVVPVKPTSSAENDTLSQPMSVQTLIPAIRAGGSPEAFARPSMLGILLYGILGAKAVAGAADPWTHTFTPAGTQPWLTFYRSVGASVYERFVDCKIAWLRLVSHAGKPLTASFGVVGITPRYRTSDAGGSIEGGIPFLHYDAQAALKVEGTAVSAIDDIDILIKRQTEATDRLTGPHVRTGPRLEVTARVGQVASSMALWNRLYYGSASPADNTAGVITPLELAGSPAGLSFKFTRTPFDPTMVYDAAMTYNAAVAYDVGSSGPERSLHLDIPRVYVQSIDGPAGLDRVVRQVVTYAALKPASAAGITATLVNGRSTY